MFSADPPRLSAPQSFLIDQFFCSAYMNGGAPALAQMLGVGTRQLDRILLDQFGMNFREKLNHTKLNYAVQLLSNRALSIEQVAHLLGYSTATAFGAFIKKETGQTPTQLRRAIWSKPILPDQFCTGRILRFFNVAVKHRPSFQSGTSKSLMCRSFLVRRYPLPEYNTFLCAPPPSCAKCGMP